MTGDEEWRTEVIASTLTFIGSVSPAVFQGANLVFVDCDRTSWNMDPDLLKNALEDCKRRGKMPKAVVPTDLYGQCCDLPLIVSICNQYNIPVVCDSAEALGAKYKLATDPHRHTQTFIQRTPVPSPGATGQASLDKNSHRFAKKMQNKLYKARVVGGEVAEDLFFIIPSAISDMQ